MRDGALGSNLDIQFFGYLLDVRPKLPINLQALLESRDRRTRPLSRLTAEGSTGVNNGLCFSLLTHRFALSYKPKFGGVLFYGKRILVGTDRGLDPGRAILDAQVPNLYRGPAPAYHPLCARPLARCYPDHPSFFLRKLTVAVAEAMGGE
jgi:hypothetical protein